MYLQAQIAQLGFEHIKVINHTCQTISTKPRPGQSGRNVNKGAVGTKEKRDADCEYSR